LDSVQEGDQVASTASRHSHDQRRHSVTPPVKAICTRKRQLLEAQSRSSVKDTSILIKLFSHFRIRFKGVAWPFNAHHSWDVRDLRVDIPSLGNSDLNEPRENPNTIVIDSEDRLGISSKARRREGHLTGTTCKTI
jgi:hypothetical protein